MARIVFTLEDGTEIETELDSDLVTIGRHPESMVVLPSSSVSSHHATIKRRGDDYYVQDLGTTNGTKLNGAEVEEAKLAQGDHLMFGDIPAALFLTDAQPPKVAVPESAPAKSSPQRASGPVVQAAKAVNRPKITSRPTPQQYQESSGCAGFLMLLVFLSIAFLIGLCLRHYNETQGFLPLDLLTKMRSKSEGDAAPEKPKAAGPETPAKPAASGSPAPAAPAKPGAAMEMNMSGEPKM